MGPARLKRSREPPAWRPLSVQSTAGTLPAAKPAAASSLGLVKFVALLALFELVAAALVWVGGIVFYVPPKGSGGTIARVYTDLWLPQWAYHGQVALLAAGWTALPLRLLAVPRWVLGGIAAAVLTLALSVLWTPFEELGVATLIRQSEPPIGLVLFGVPLLIPAALSVWLAARLGVLTPGAVAASLVFWLALLVSGGDRSSLLQAALWAVPPMQLALPLGVAAASTWSRALLLLGGMLLLLVACVAGGVAVWMAPLPSWLL